MTIKNLDQRSPRFEAAHKKWQMVDDLWQGTDGMRTAGDRYIPREVGENTSDNGGTARYEARLNRSTLTNFYKKTILKHTGKVFQQQIKLEDYDQVVEDWCQNIDLRNNTLTQFGEQVFKDAYNKGVTYINSDHQVNPLADDDSATLADEQNLGLRPYLHHIPASHMLDIRGDYLNNDYVPVMVRYLEEVLEYPEGGYLPEVIKQVKILEIGKWTTYRSDSNGEWNVHQTGNTNLDFIPITAFVTNPTGFMIGEPPLEELAEKTVQYWRESSDVSNVLHVINSPILHYRGNSQDPATGKTKDIIVGPNAFIQSNNKDNVLEWVEHSGSAIQSSQDNLKNLRDEMTLLGLEPLVVTSRTATEADLASHEANSMVKSMAILLKGVLERNLLWMVQYQNKTATMQELGSVHVNTNYGINGGDSADAPILEAMLEKGILSKKQFLEEMMRRGVVNPDLDADEVLEEAEKEAEENKPEPAVVQNPLINNEEVPTEAPVSGETE